MNNRSKMLLWANIIASFFVITLISYLYFVTVWADFSGGLLQAENRGTISIIVLMIPGALVLLAGIVLEWAAFIKKSTPLLRLANIFCTVGTVMTHAFAVCFITSVVLWWIGYVKCSRQ